LRALVEREIAWAQRGEAAHIVLKMNALVDAAAIDLLQRASHAGVQVDLIVRGVSVLRPRVPGVSDRIRVRSIVGRFLEHSRIWYFRNGGVEDTFIGSADLMPRNFDRRIEIVVPLKDRAVAHRVRYEILDTYLSDTLSARELLSSGRYRRLVPKPGEPGISSQSLLIDLAAAEHLDLPSRRSEQLAETR
jgi:polyphosphate kinase